MRSSLGLNIFFGSSFFLSTAVAAQELPAAVLAPVDCLLYDGPNALPTTPVRIFSSKNTVSFGSPPVVANGTGKYDITIDAAANSSTEIGFFVEITGASTRLGTVAVGGWGSGINETLVWIDDEV